MMSVRSTEEHCKHQDHRQFKGQRYSNTVHVSNGPQQTHRNTVNTTEHCQHTRTRQAHRHTANTGALPIQNTEQERRKHMPEYCKHRSTAKYNKTSTREHCQHTGTLHVQTLQAREYCQHKERTANTHEHSQYKTLPEYRNTPTSSEHRDNTGTTHRNHTRRGLEHSTHLYKYKHTGKTVSTTKHRKHSKCPGALPTHRNTASIWEHCQPSAQGRERTKQAQQHSTVNNGTQPTHQTAAQ